jgi:ABC-type nitrate/sulfonate/bicarbonate transport system permease component
MVTLLERRGTDVAPVADVAAELTAARRSRRSARTRRLGTGACGLALALAVWEIAALIIAKPEFLPSVQTTVITFGHYFNRPYPSIGDPLWKDVAISSSRILIGFAIGTVTGVMLGAAMYALRPLRELIDPIIEVTRPLPPLAFIPLLIVWFGIGELPKVVLITVGVLPIMVVATVAALDGVASDMVHCARTLGASRSYALWHVQIRAAMPGIVTGMRIAMAGSWTSIVAVEMIAATSGVGYLILQAGNYLQTGLVFCGIICIGIMGLTFDLALRGIRRLADPSPR